MVSRGSGWPALAGQGLHEGECLLGQPGATVRVVSRGGVTACRSVVVLITHRIGPTPSRKKPRPARAALGTMLVSASTMAATSPVTGPSAITVPNGSHRIIRVAASAPTTMPTPYIDSVVPTPVADNPRRRTA